ncbi:MAG: carboxymuconolactone decarboxylase family protein [Dehalococcoidia bacterium]|nr:carboxymuconolactone decarboxylase family protein [Dehalococcoidia bacterium]
MTRLPNMLDRDQLPDGLRESYDRVAGSRGGTVSGPYGILLHSPELAERGAALSEYLRWNSALTPAQRELAIMTAAREFDANVMWAGHVRLGREAGVRDEAIDCIAHRGDAAGLTTEEGEIVRYVRELLQTNRVSAPTFEALHQRLGDQGIVDLTGLVGYYAFVGSVLNAFEVEPADGARALPTL